MSIDLKDKNFDFEGVDLNPVGRGNEYVLESLGVEVRVCPEFIDSQVGLLGELYIWTYRVFIRNKRKGKVRLLRRFWKIIDDKGAVQEVEGEGVIGKQPWIESGEEFEYNSGVHLEKSSSGIMVGKYFVVDEKGEEFEVGIPAFSLDTGGEPRALN